MRELFSFIDKGEETLGVYEYNGGLFDSRKHPFLDEKYKIGNKYVAEALLKVSYSETEGGFIDYQDLDVRELGAIYEGLLEHKPVIEEEKVQWKEDPSERKKTGSYYTPEYIVKYIVENTIGPLVEEKKDEIEEEINELKEELKGSRGYDRETYQRKLEEKRKEVREEILDLKVLDPAMGSGHFLVEATEKLANSVAALEEEFSPDGEGESTVQGAKEEDTVKELKRQIVERSIYGVDKNPLATELAKLSLWLHTVAKGEPLSFLDHHLRTGDSLIGIDIEEMKTMPSEREQMAGLFTSNLVQDLGKAIGHLSLIEEITSGSRDDVQEKKAEWRDVRNWIDKYKKAVNVRLSASFGNEVSDDEYRAVLQAGANDDMEKIRTKQFFKNAQRIAKNKSFFHWELEFPDVFRNRIGKVKEKSGFDVTIGNPPYRTKSLGKGQQEDRDEIDYLRQCYPLASEYKVNTYLIFLKLGINKLASSGFLGMIIPDTLLTKHYHSQFREDILTHYQLGIIGQNHTNVFKSGETGGTLEIILKREPPQYLSKICKLNPSNVFEKTGEVNQKEFLDRSDNKIFLDLEGHELIRKINRSSSKLDEHAIVYNGIKSGNNDRFLSDSKETEKHKKVIRGRDIGRYYLQWGRIYILFEPERLWSNTNKSMFEASSKVLVRQTGDRLVAARDRNGRYSMDTTHLIIPISVTDDYLVALLNSKLMDWYYSKTVPEKGRSFAEVKASNLRKLPLRITKNSNFLELLEKNADLIHNLKKDISKINLNIQDYLGNFSEGMTLSDLYTPVKGTSSEIFTKTCTEMEGLKIEDVSFQDLEEDIILNVNLRWKPEDQGGFDNLDRWGYVKSEFKQAMRFQVDKKMEALIKEFVPFTVNKADGFANFRQYVTKTISPLERLEKLTLPKLDDVKSRLEKYLEQKEKAEELEEEVKETKHKIDAIVFDLYSLNKDEVKMVLNSLETPEEEKSDILNKFRQVG